MEGYFRRSLVKKNISAGLDKLKTAIMINQ